MAASDALVVRMSMSFVVDFSVEAVLVGGVFDFANFVVGLDNAVFSLYFLAITSLPLVLDVVVLGVMDGVVEVVVRVTL